MKANPSTRSRYPAHRAFVVQMAQPSPGDENVPLGRAEHLVSGQSTHFISWAELEAFIEQVLARMEDKPP
ncbi:MAG: hypothetical protein AB7G75_31470 [Candidatus Binatia bacterium]